MRAIRWGLVAVLVAGAMLRFTALDYGLPRTDLGTDEQITRLRVLYGTDTERLSTPKYNWPQLNVYASRAAVWLARRVEGVAGHEPREALWIGRAYTAVLGVLTLWLVYGVGRRLFGPAVGVMSAGFLAFMPLHANRSRLWVPDVPMTAAYTLTLLAAVWALQRPSWRRFALGGVAVGLATAFKYNGAGACLALVVAATIVALRTGGGRAWMVAAGRLAVAGGVSLATFVACDPPVVRQLDHLVYGVTWIGEIYTSEPSTGPFGWHTISYILRSFFAGGYEGVGAWTCLVAILGLALLVSRRRDAAAVIAVLPGVLYLLGYSLVLRNPFERMFLPLLPHLALAAGYGAVVAMRFLVSRIERRRWRVAVAAALAAAILAAAAPQAVAHAVAAGRGDTRLDALAWIRENVPVGAAVLCEWDMLQPSGRRYERTGRPYNLYKLAKRPAQLTRRWDYVVASSRTYDWVLRQRSRPGFDRRAALYDALFDSPRFEEVARFTPGLRRYGPELRIFRTRPPRGPRFSPTAAGGSSALRLEPWAWVPSRRLRSRSQPGAYRLWRPGDTVAGRAIVDRPGCYELSFSARAREPRDLEVTLGSRTATFALAGETTLRLARRLDAGQVWWRLRAPRAAGSPVARVWNLRLARVTGPTGAGCSGDR